MWRKIVLSPFFQNGKCVYEPIIFGVWVTIMKGYSVSCFFFFYAFPVIAFFFFYGAIVFSLRQRQVRMFSYILTFYGKRTILACLIKCIQVWQRQQWTTTLPCFVVCLFVYCCLCHTWMHLIRQARMVLLPILQKWSQMIITNDIRQYIHHLGSFFKTYICILNMCYIVLYIYIYILDLTVAVWNILGQYRFLEP